MCEAAAQQLISIPLVTWTNLRNAFPGVRVTLHTRRAENRLLHPQPISFPEVSCINLQFAGGCSVPLSSFPYCPCTPQQWTGQDSYVTTAPGSTQDCWLSRAVKTKQLELWQTTELSVFLSVPPSVLPPLHDAFPYVGRGHNHTHLVFPAKSNKFSLNLNSLGQWLSLSTGKQTLH